MENVKNKRIVFMGTTDFAQAILKTILNEGYNVVGVVTQPDRPVGRRQILQPSLVKQTALTHDLLVLQPLKIRKDYQPLLDLCPDLIITCAYGQIIPPGVLEAALCVNIHASLLPELRGGAPMHRAIMNGFTETGITLMRMAAKMDDGDIIAQQSVPITYTDTVGSLQEKLIELACQMISQTLPAIINGQITFTPQREADATFGYNITKEEEFVAFAGSYDEVYNHIRALIPWPISYGRIADLQIKFYAVAATNETTAAANGTVVGIDEQGLRIAVDQRILLITELQVAGRNKTSARDFANGIGKRLIGQRFM